MQYAVCCGSQNKRYLTLGNLYLLITLPGGRRFWELVSVGGGVVMPRPGPADTAQEEVGKVQGCQQQEPKVELKDEVVDPMERSVSN